MAAFRKPMEGVKAPLLVKFQMIHRNSLGESPHPETTAPDSALKGSCFLQAAVAKRHIKPLMNHSHSHQCRRKAHLSCSDKEGCSKKKNLEQEWKSPKYNGNKDELYMLFCYRFIVHFPCSPQNNNNNNNSGVYLELYTQGCYWFKFNYTERTSH